MITDRMKSKAPENIRNIELVDINEWLIWKEEETVILIV